MPRLPADLSRSGLIAAAINGSPRFVPKPSAQLVRAAAMEAAARRHGPVPTKPRAEKSAWEKLVEDRETFAHVARRMVGK